MVQGEAEVLQGLLPVEQMEANNLFNFGGHPSESANSGLKHSSGDTLYSNGSSMSFPQPGKNMNGDMNVNGITTVIGTSASGSHPSTAYSLMSNNHHQSSLGYDYLWDQAQYNPTVSTGHGTGLHPKQSSSGVMPQTQPQPQQHFQGHGQYQLNGGVGGVSRQSSVAAPPNVTLTGQYWSRGSPGPQQGASSMNISYGASNVYSSYQNQVHPSMTPPQHQHQQQHHQQQSHLGMVSNGMAYYQHQPPPPPLVTTQTQSQASMIPATAQNFTPPCSSPQLQHHLGYGESSSSIPSVAVPPSNIPENGALQCPDTSLCSEAVLPTVMQGHLNDVYKEVDTAYSETEQTAAVEQLPEAEVFTSMPPAPQMVPPSNYCPPAQHTPPDMGHPINKCPNNSVTVTDPTAPVASPLPVMLVETSSHMADQSGLADKIDPSLAATEELELTVGPAKIKGLEVTDRDSLMVSQLEVKLEKPCGVSATTVPSSTPPGTDKTSDLFDLGSVPFESANSSVGEDSLNNTCETEKSTNYTAPMNSSFTDSSGAEGTSTLEETLSKDNSHANSESVGDSLVMEKSVDVSSQHNTSQVRETVDTGSTTKESVSLNDTSQRQDSFSASQNANTASTSDSIVCMSSPSDGEYSQKERSVPDSPLGSPALTLSENQKEIVRCARDSLPNDCVLSLSSPGSSVVTQASRKLSDLKLSLSQSIVGHGNQTRPELKGRIGSEMTGLVNQTTKMKSPAKFPAGQLIGSSSEPYPIQQQNLLPVKPKKEKRVKKLLVKPLKVEVVKNDEDDDEEDEAANVSGDVQRRRIATEEQVNFPLLHGWRREVRVRKCESRLKGETWYYSPCGKRMKQFPEVIKYLNRHQGSVVTREHFSFSPRMPVGDFFEERETTEGMKWFLLADEEVPSIIMAITGRRGRPPNPDKERPRARRTQGGSSRRPGRPPKMRMVDLLSKVDAKLLKRLEAQETLSEEDKEKLNKIKKKLKRKARNRKKQAAKIKKSRQEKRKAKLEKTKELQEQEGPGEDQSPPQPMQEAKKPGRRKREKGVEEKVEDKEDPQKRKRSSGARNKAKAQAKAQAEAEAQAQAVLAARRQAERRAQAQRRQEERRRQQLILEELKKPTEDMCLTDHQPLPEFSRVPGVVLSGQAFSHCLMVVEFLQSYGKVLGLQVPRDVPSLSTLQEGLLGLGDSQGEVQDLLVKLVQAALCDPGLPSYYQSVKILGEKLVDLELNRSSVSEGLRVFLESHGFEAEVCKSLRSKPFQAHTPDAKASILAFLVDELNGSNIIIREIDNTLESMATYRKNKWTIEGKLRKLKAALARRTGRSEDELGLEDRRRSARVAEEESLGLEESGLLERSSRRSRKEDVQLSEGESPTTASIPELERQIDKLNKRQVFFRKKLLQASHSLRAVSLGQDRYRRRYWVMPHIGGILVEGPEEILVSDDILVKEEVEPVFPVKTEPKPEPKSEPPPLPTSALSPNRHISPLEVDPLLGTASLMSSPRGRGRPRKIKPEVELHLRAAKNRRRRRSSKVVSEEWTESDTSQRGMQDFTQSAFLSWLSQTEGCVPAGVTGTDVHQGEGGPQESVKEMAEKQGQWFNLLPKTPCDSSSVSQSSVPISSPKDMPQSPEVTPGLAASLLKPGQLFPDSSLSPQVCSTPVLKLARRRRRRSSSAQGTAGRFFPGTTKRRGRPPSKLLQEIEQKYFTQLIAKPIPAAMVHGWWWIKEPEELKTLLQVLHPRGIREKALHKHLSKHMEFLTEFCSRTISDPIFQCQVEEGGPLSQALQQPWKEFEKTMETDISVLQWVEDLEQRVFAADLQIKIAPQSGPSDTDGNTETTAPGFQGFTVPEPDSTRFDLQYYDHDVELLDDWIVKTKKEWSNLLRVPTNPLDLAVLRLLNLERNIERRYLKEPLWTPNEVVRLAPLTPIPGEENHLDIESLESEITPRLRAWRQAVDRCRSAAQLSLCLLQLERAIAWEKSVIKVTCLVCRKGDNDEYLLLCDGCDRGCHMYCLRPKVTQVPEGDWFCPVCTSKENGESGRPRRFPKSRARKRHVGCYGSGSSDEDDGYKKGGGMTTRRREGPAASSYARFSGESGGSSSSPSKRRRMTTRNQPDLTYCEIILMEMEAHADAWPFLEPVNPRLVPGYRRIIKHPMDFLTMRERLLQGGYCSSEEFAADAQLVFNNCQLFNEDTSEVGMAGHSMRRFFESRWAEFYQKKDK
ncbi:bromodomain adjacent to zinc finger domain protein 2A [Arapaima gigas]